MSERSTENHSEWIARRKDRLLAYLSSVDLFVKDFCRFADETDEGILKKCRENVGGPISVQASRNATGATLSFSYEWKGIHGNVVLDLEAVHDDYFDFDEYRIKSVNLGAFDPERSEDYDDLLKVYYDPRYLHIITSSDFNLPALLILYSYGIEELVELFA